MTATLLKCVYVEKSTGVYQTYHDKIDHKSAYFVLVDGTTFPRPCHQIG